MRVISVVARMDPYETVQTVTVDDSTSLSLVEAGLERDGYTVVGVEYEIDLEDEEEFEDRVTW